MGQMVIAVYKPKQGGAEGLEECLRHHLPILRAEGLATDRPAVVMRAADGSFLEVFEWKSAEAVEDAHENPAVLRLWERFAEVCDYGILAELDEATGQFPNFEAVDL